MRLERVLRRAAWGLPLVGGALLVLAVSRPGSEAPLAAGGSIQLDRASMAPTILLRPALPEPESTSPATAEARSAVRSTPIAPSPASGARVVGFARRARDWEPATRFLVRLYRDEPENVTPFPIRSEEFSNPRGSFEFLDLDPGLYLVEILAEGFAPARSDAVLLGPGEMSAPIELALEEGALARGFIVAASDRSAIAGAEVELSFLGLERPCLPLRTTTDPDGAFTFRDLPAGPCRVAARLAERGAAGSAEVVLEAGRPSPILEISLHITP